MKRFLKIITSFSIIACMMLTPVHAFASSSKATQKVLLPEIEVTAAQLSDGITVLLTRNDDNTYTQTIYTNPADVPMLLATADGVIDWAEFHLGFKDWTNYSNELYFNVSSDEPLDKIEGKAYVKSTSYLNPEEYYSDSFKTNLYGSSNTGRQLSSGVDTKDATKVRVRFKDVWLMAISGDYCVFKNDSVIVEKE